MVNLAGAIGQGAVVAVTIKAIDKFSNTFKQANTGMKVLGNTFKVGATALAAAGAGFAALGTTAVKIAGDFEQTEVAFTTMLGSAEKAGVFLKDLTDFAKKTPFTLPGVEKSARQLLAVGFEAENVLPTLKDIGNVASGLGLGEEGLQRLILNLGQVQSQGKLTGRELRDFAVAGVPILEELSKSLGKTTSEVQEMISAGEIETSLVLKAFNQMASEGGRFADLMDKQAKTVQGRFSNLKDTLTITAREIGTSLLPVVGKLADSFLDDVLPALQPIIPVLGEFLSQVVEGLVPHLPRITEMLLKTADVFMRLFDALSPLIDPLMEITFVLFDALFEILDPLLPIIKILANLIGENLKSSLISIKPVLDILVAGLKLLMKLLEPIIDFIADLSIGINRFFGNLKGGFGRKIAKTLGVESKQVVRNESILETPEKDAIRLGEPKNVINISIDKVQGTDPDDMAEAMAIQLNSSIRR